MNKAKSAGFSLIELIAVILVLSIISVFAYTRFSSSAIASVQTARDQLMSSLSQAQQIAMARSSAGTTIQLTIDTNRLNLTENGISLQLLSDNYPEDLPPGVSITSGTGILSYDKLGRVFDQMDNPVNKTITLSRGGTTATIHLEATGYAYY